MSKCDTCIYRALKGKPWKCEYIEITGHNRNCEPGNLCTEYKKGKRIKLPTKQLYYGDKYDLNSINVYLNKFK